eukprot:14464-Heterococcus_DN1.PRE.2
MAAARMLTMMCTMQLWHIWKEIPAAWCQHWAIAEVTTWQPLQTVRSFDVVHVSSVLCDADLCYSACKAAVARKDGKRKNMEIAATAVTSAVARGASSEEVDALETQAVLTETKYVKALTGDGTAKGMGWKRNGQIDGKLNAP